jgi:hypothetical protein
VSIKDILKTGVKANFENLHGDRYVASAKPQVEPIAPRASCWTLEIPGWMPTPLNKLLHCHWGTASKLKDNDLRVISDALTVYGVPEARAKRSVRLLVVLPKGKRAVDPDALHKSLNDALVRCKALVNDSSRWVQIEQPRFARGEELTTFLTLEDVA